MNATYYFSKNPKAENYSESYSHMIIERQGQEIITTYYSRWNSVHNTISKQIV